MLLINFGAYRQFSVPKPPLLLAANRCASVYNQTYSDNTMFRKKQLNEMYFNATKEELTEEKYLQLREVQRDFTQLMYKMVELKLPILIDFRIVESKHTKFTDKFYINLLCFKKTMRAICGLSIETAFPESYKELNYDFKENKLYSQDL